MHPWLPGPVNDCDELDAFQRFCAAGAARLARIAVLAAEPRQYGARRNAAYWCLKNRKKIHARLPTMKPVEIATFQSA